MREFLHWIPNRDRMRRDIDEEIAFDLEMRVEELRANGCTIEQAHRIAREEFGDINATRAYCLHEDERRMRDTNRATRLQEVQQDLSHAFRLFHRHRGFTIAVILTLALGIGASTTMFSVVNALLLNALPYGDAERVTRIYGSRVENPEMLGQISAADIVDYKQRSRSFEVLAGIASGGGVVHGFGDPQPISGVRVAADAFTALGVEPMLGRSFDPVRDYEAPAESVILGHNTWQRLFGGDSTVIGKSISIGTGTRRIVGVLPAGFFFPGFTAAELYTPLDLRPTLADANRARKYRYLGMVGRLKAGVTLDQANAELRDIAGQLAREYPDANEGLTVRVLSVREAITGDVRPGVLMVFGASVVLLLIACVNIAGMLLTRAVGRQHELSLRAALGAGRGRLLRQLLVESTVLAVAGGAAGLLVAMWGTKAFLRVAEGMLPIQTDLRADAPVWLFAILATVTCGVLFGMAPALSATRDLQARIREGRSASNSAARMRLRTTLLTGQVALAVVLLSGAGLMLRSIAEIQRVQLGYSIENVLSFRISLPGSKYSDVAAVSGFFDQLTGRLKNVGGVVATGTAGNIPLLGGSSASLAIEGRPDPQGALPEVGYQSVSESYFETMRIPFKAGRAFTNADAENTPGVAIVNESTARRFWGELNPIGARIRLGPDPSVPWLTVVGVVADVRGGIVEDARPTVHVSMRQDAWSSAMVLLRTTVDASSILPAARAIVRELDPQLPLMDIQTLEQRKENSLTERRVPMQLLTVFAGIALVLAGVGIFGTMAYSVASRTREIGIRVALGARPASVFGMIMRQGLLTMAIGIVLGVAGAIGLGKLLASLLYGVQPSDPRTLAMVLAALVAVAAAACAIPLRRALRVDPIIALRDE